jgi:hypothetical protein
MRPLLIIAVVLAACAPAMSDTYVTENITTDTQWTVTGSPYIVQGSVAVLSSSTLTIDPGVVVKMDASATLSTQAGNTILAVGTEGNEILFTSNAGTPAPDDWQYLYIRESAATTFEYCVFEYGRYNVYFQYSDATFSHCTSRYGDNAGLYIDKCSPLIEYCNIEENPRGMFIFGPDASPVIHGCNLQYNSSSNMYLAGYNPTRLVTIDAEDNWWGADAYLDINETIEIQMSSAPYVEVDFDPWLHEVPVEETSWARVKALYQ